VDGPGRRCPPDYGYTPSSLARAAELHADVLYVAGGLYGNLEALDAIEAMARQERAAKIVFNGDFHWFDAEPAWFAEVQTRVQRHTALRGNVETELAADRSEHGCGCAYPPEVPDDDVERSNRLLARLRAVAQAAERSTPGTLARLATLPMTRVAAVGGARIGIVHGDAHSLAGWRFAHDALHAADDAALTRVFEQAAVDVFACTHTCLPALRVIETPGGERAVVNNGAAGMANFAGDRRGLVTRIACEPVPRALAPLRRYGAAVAGVYVDALAVAFDAAAWDARFSAFWPPGSDAALSYGARIAHGPAFSVDAALGRVPARCAVVPA
jgi:predicted phosphodiesterase